MTRVVRWYLRANRRASVAITEGLRPFLPILGPAMSLPGAFLVHDPFWSWYLVLGGMGLSLCYLMEEYKHVVCPEPKPRKAGQICPVCFTEIPTSGVCGVCD